MDLVQDHGRHPIQAGIGLEAPDQQTLRDDLDSGLGGYGRLQAGAKAHRSAD